MRLFPPAYVIGRQVDEDVIIGGYLLKKAEMVLISQYVMHRDLRYFNNPELFLPERFENTFQKNLPEYAYFPFGGRPRVCIGNHFALMEAVLVLACIAQQYKVRLASNHQEIKPQPLITLRPKGGIRLIVEKRATETVSPSHIK